MPALLVLSVEDNDGDFAIMKFVLRQCLDSVDLRRAADGEQAVMLLKAPADSIIQPRLDLILLDIDIPRMNGFEILVY